MKFEKCKAKRAAIALTVACAAAVCGLAACAPALTETRSAAQGGPVVEFAAGDSLTVSTPVTAATDAMPATSKHDEQGVKCIVCHGSEAPDSAPTSNEACLSCHNQETLIASTAGWEDVSNRQVNPHDNHMHGVSCFSCHSNHGTSTVACNECHTNEYNWLVP